MKVSGSSTRVNTLNVILERRHKEQVNLDMESTGFSHKIHAVKTECAKYERQGLEALEKNDMPCRNFGNEENKGKFV